MSEQWSSGHQGFLRLPSSSVLALARGMYLLLAIGCLAAVAGGLLWVLVLQLSTAAGPPQVAVPPPWHPTVAPPQLPPREMDLDAVGARLSPPANVRFEVGTGVLTALPQPGLALGRFQAETTNGLARWPDGVSVLGGPDADLFERVPVDGGAAVGLAPRPALLEQFGTALAQGLSGSRDFTVRVVVRDRFGQRSAPADVTFNLRYEPPPPPPMAPVSVPTPLEQLARDIARHLEPEVNPAFFAAYEQALTAPTRCGARPDDAVFIENYRRAFETLRDRLGAGTVAAFYDGICAAWQQVLAREQALIEAAETLDREARTAAEVARAQAEAQNREARSRHEARVAQARAQTLFMLILIGGALGLFLSVSVLLAFLAIEGHSRAVRTAMETIAGRWRESAPVMQRSVG